MGTVDCIKLIGVRVDGGLVARCKNVLLPCHRLASPLPRSALPTRQWHPWPQGHP